MNLCTSCREREQKHPRTGECGKCYQNRWYREHRQRDRIPEADRRDPIGYKAAHVRVRRVRGRAAEQVCAWSLPTDQHPAEEWSYTLGDEWEQSGMVLARSGAGRPTAGFMHWSPNPYAYEPLCKAHHMEKDGS